MAKGAYVGIPTSYTPVEYIESSGTQYIDTGIYPYQTQTEVKFGGTSLSATGVGDIAGCWNSDNNRYYVCAYVGSTSPTKFWSVDRSNTAITLLSPADTSAHTVIYNDSNNKVFFDGVEKGTVSDLTTQVANQILLFARMGGNGAENYYTGRIYYAKIYDKSTNVLVRNYIPVLDYNNVACLYDQVEGKFYYNQGTGTFTAGTASTPVSIGGRARKISKMYVGVPTSYTPVEYIESSGTQDIDTGVVRDITKKYEFKGSFSFSNATNRQLNGAQGAMYIGVANGYYQGAQGGTTTTTIPVPINTFADFDITFDGVNSVWYGNINGSSVSPTSVIFADSPAGAHFHIFTLNDMVLSCKEKVAWWKIYENDVLIRDYIPVVDDNNVACLYEQVEGKFYYNENYGAFTAGNVTGQPVNIGGITRKITKAYVGVNGVARLFYAPFKQIDYIESTGTQYIDTGFKHNQNTRMVLDIDVDERFSQVYTYLSMFGSWGGPSTNKKMFGVEFNQNSNAAVLYYGNGNSQGATSYTGRKIWDLNKNVYKVGTSTYTFTAATFQSEFNDYIFAASGYSGLPGGKGIKMKLYSCKIYDNGVLVRDYIPVIDSSNVACLYEQVEKKFYYNQGTGQFIPSETDQWEKLNYVESTGTQYIDTKVFANPNTRMYLDQVTTNYSYQDRLIGANPGGNFWYEVYINGGRTYAFAYQDDSGNWVSTSCSAGNNTRLFIDLDGVAKTVKTASSTSSQIYSNPLSAYTATKTSLNTIKLIGTTETSYPRAKMRVNRCDIYDNGTQVRMLIPVRKKSDQAICMYDMISKKFFYNAGTGTFSFG